MQVERPCNDWKGVAFQDAFDLNLTETGFLQNCPIDARVDRNDQAGSRFEQGPGAIAIEGGNPLRATDHRLRP